MLEQLWLLGNRNHTITVVLKYLHSDINRMVQNRPVMTKSMIEMKDFNGDLLLQVHNPVVL